MRLGPVLWPVEDNNREHEIWTTLEQPLDIFVLLCSLVTWGRCCLCPGLTFQVALFFCKTNFSVAVFFKQFVCLRELKLFLLPDFKDPHTCLVFHLL